MHRGTFREYTLLCVKVHRKLAPDSRYFIGSDLDHHLDSILHNSMAVAHVSRDHYREAILQLCSEVSGQPSSLLHVRWIITHVMLQVLTLRKELGENLAVVTSYPESVEARYCTSDTHYPQIYYTCMCRTAFDQTAEQLCEKLCEIDRWVADAVVDQVTEVFVEPSAPISHLVRAVAGSPATTSPGVSIITNVDCISLFLCL